MKKQRVLSIVLALALALSLVPVGFGSSTAMQGTLGQNFGKNWGTIDSIRVFEVTIPVRGMVHIIPAELVGYSGPVSTRQMASEVSTISIRYTGNQSCTIEGVRQGHAEVTFAQSYGSPKDILKVYIRVVSESQYTASTAHEHEYQDVVQNATCLTDGRVYRECKLCKNIQDDQSLPATGHTYDAGTVTTQPTSTHSGERTYTCIKCRASYTETIPMTGNGTGSSEPAQPVPPEHTRHTWKTEIVKEPTCASNGESREVCSGCGAVNKTTVLPQTKQHTWENILEVPATCKVQGRQRQVCAVCGAKGSSTTIPKTTDHVWEDRVTPATCKKEGQSWQQCSVCAKTQNAKNIPKTEHNFVEGQITRQPTVTQVGQRLDKCSVCGAVKYVELPKAEETPVSNPGTTQENSTPSAIPGTSSTNTPNAAAIPMQPKEVPTKSTNYNAQDYSTGPYADTVDSYLYANGTGGLTRVESVGKEILVENYDNSFKLLSGCTISKELPLLGGFYAGKDYNFFVFGQENREENDQKEVIRVVKYSKDWQRLGQASLCGANTTIPFKAGSLRCDEYEGYLYIRTCHQMYASEKDGLNHQANLTVAVHQDTMAITDACYDVMNQSCGYVSHSFNQFILVNQQGKIAAVDHGDAYPRGIAFAEYHADAGKGKFTGTKYGSGASMKHF